MSMELSEQVALRGTDHPPAEPELIRCGPLSLLLDRGEIRDLSAAGTHLVAHIYVTVRDKDWNTIEPDVTVTGREVSDESVRIRLTARNHGGDIHLHWQGTIELTSDGVFTYDLDGQADSGFAYCRIGFCLLFGSDAASGRPYRASTTEGFRSGTLPTLIEPQRIVDGVELALFPPCDSFELSLPGGGNVRTEFVGDLFEMEDQRNWTDGSFKMYCTPIALGYPHQARAGQTFRQRVRVSTDIRGASRAGPDDARPARLDLAGHTRAHRPPIGMGQSSVLNRPMAPAEVALISSLGPDHLRADIHLDADDWPAALGRAITDSQAVGCPLELAVHVDAVGPAVQQLAAQVEPATLSRILVLDATNHGTATTPPSLVSAVRDVLRAAGVAVAIGGGTDGDFAELNRERPDVSGAAFVAYGMNPQVHVFDDRSLFLALPTQAATVVTARSFCGDTPVVVSPVTLRQRFNPAAMTPGSDDASPGPGGLPAAVDQRQMSLFAAAWTLGSMASLIGAGVASVTYFETVGWRGVLERAIGDPMPGPFHCAPGMVFPVYHLWRDLTEDVAGQECTPILDQSAGIAAISMPIAGGRRTVIANLYAGPPRQVTVLGLIASRVRVRTLDASIASDAAHRPAEFRNRWQWTQPVNDRVTLQLPAYAYARLDELEDTRTRLTQTTQVGL